MSALEEVDVEEQLQNQDDSDTPVIKINTEVSNEKKEPKFALDYYLLLKRNKLQKLTMVGSKKYR